MSKAGSEATQGALRGTEALSEQLNERERELLALVVQNGGSARQSDIVESMDIGRNQVSCYVRDLNDAGHLRKVQLGVENVLYLPGCEPDIVQSSLEEAMQR